MHLTSKHSRIINNHMVGALISLAVFVVFLQSCFSYQLVTIDDAPIFCLFLWKVSLTLFVGWNKQLIVSWLRLVQWVHIKPIICNIESKIFHIDAWWRLPIHLIWADECSHITHIVLQGMMETDRSSYMSRWMSTCHSHSGSRLSQKFIPKSSTDA
jgi:hypothetical protein